jgi:hypothetical protein
MAVTIARLKCEPVDGSRNLWQDLKRKRGSVPIFTIINSGWKGKDEVRTTDGSSGLPSFWGCFCSCSGACERNHGEVIPGERTFDSKNPVTYPFISHTLA